MNKFRKISLCLIILLSITTITANAQEKVTPQEVIQKAREASAFLQKNGKKGLKEFMDKNSRWVWKDTYIFIMNCKSETVAAHPFKSKLVGKKLMGLKDINGRFFFAEFCAAAEDQKGGWVEYMWQKIGEEIPSRKISYLLQVPETIYQVGVGIYDDTISIEELNKFK
ncbi:cache domain-containing protein [Desulfobacterales bacterium HSG17]|nr:cache domain-containing protein [Desulfobacterales bacterium HSG17]